MRSLSLLAFLLPLCLPLAASAQPLRCDNREVPLRERTEYWRAADEAAALHAYYGDLDIKKAGPAFDAVLLQRCVSRDSAFEGITVHFKVNAKRVRSSAGTAKTYVCQTQLKRRVEHDRRWSRWFNVETLCRVGRLERRRPGTGSGYETPGYGSGSGGYDGPTTSPDDRADPDFRDRDPDYGPDSTPDFSGDGSSGRSGSEFGDIRF